MNRSTLKFTTATFVVFAVVLFACKGVKKTTSSETSDAWKPVELTYKASAQNILTTNCSKCHGAGKKIDMTTYMTVKKFVDNGKLKQTVIVEKSMPKDHKISLQDYETIKRWLEAGAPE